MNNPLPCGWGRVVGMRNGSAPCDAQATQRVALHDGDSSFYVQVCDPHFRIIVEDTKEWCPHGPA